jgi:hypothetical protein
MKKACLVSAIVASFLLCSNRTEAQTTQTQLNQVDLMKQFLGSWKCELDKGKMCYMDVKLYGSAYEEKRKYVKKDKTFDSWKEVMGYDKNVDKFIDAQIWKSSADIHLYALWFTSKNICEIVLFKDVSNPDKAELKWKWEFKSSDSVTETKTKDGKEVSVLTYTRYTPDKNDLKNF